MAASRPNLGLQIALIIFVLITIALGVSTVVYFNQTKELAAAAKAAKEAEVKAVQEKKDAELAMDKLVEPFKGLSPREVPAAYKGKVDPIIDDFKKHGDEYQATFSKDITNYPTMFGVMYDAYHAVNSKIAEKDAQIAELNAKIENVGKRIDVVKADYDKAVAEAVARNKTDLDQYNLDRQTIEKDRQQAQLDVEKKNAEMKDLADKQVDEMKKVRAQLVKVQDQKKKGDEERAVLTKEDFEAPDGVIFRVDQRLRMVWINKGRIHGIKPQMIFGVYDRTADNVAGKPKAKGAIEVVRVDSSYSEARITEDDLKDPLMKDDKIMNTAYVSGRPVHFAVGGFIDIDGDGKSDMNRLLTLISTNGGIVDAMIDDNGKLTGAVTPATKLLVLGETPTDVKGQDSLKAFTRLMKDVDDAKIQKMPLATFLAYMGYKGHEKSVPLGKDAGDGTLFKKKPAAGAGGGAFP